MRWRRKSTPPLPPATDPLTAIPLKPANVELKHDSQGCLHLRLTPQLKPTQRKVTQWLGYDYTHKLALDETGTAYYQLVDGQHTLATIVDELTKKLSKDRREVATMVVMFTKMLMTRNMLALKVQAKS
ncbi:MAG: Coenzyme PQQ synthesis protein D [Verrucomicrobiae bacterium]|nr:Coenzyme PQQ synthesis protein D [Verrucomicrobiae bacterium]